MTGFDREREIARSILRDGWPFLALVAALAAAGLVIAAAASQGTIP